MDPKQPEAARTQYYERAKKILDFTDEWNFHYTLEQTRTTQSQLTSSMVDYSRPRNHENRLPIVQVRPDVIVKLEGDRLPVFYKAWMMGYLSDDVATHWRGIIEKGQELAQALSFPGLGEIHTRMAITKQNNKWMAAIALGDPGRVGSKLQSVIRRRSSEIDFRESVSDSEWRSYLESRYGRRY